MFISSGRDPAANLLVDEIHDHLSREGLKCSSTGLQPGDSWPAEIIQAVNTCKAFVAVLTKKYVKSVYCTHHMLCDFLLEDCCWCLAIVKASYSCPEYVALHSKTYSCLFTFFPLRSCFSTSFQDYSHKERTPWTFITTGGTL